MSERASPFIPIATFVPTRTNDTENDLQPANEENESQDNIWIAIVIVLALVIILLTIGLLLCRYKQGLNCKNISLNFTPNSTSLHSDAVLTMPLENQTPHTSVYEVIGNSEKILVDNVLYSECKTLQSAKTENKQVVYNHLFK